MTHRPAMETVGIDPHLIVLFGATGDLASRKLIPAIYRLLEARNFDDATHVLGVATSEVGDDGFRDIVRKSLADQGVDESEIERWCDTFLSYYRITEGFDGLAARIEEIESTHDLPGNRAYYLAIPPAVFDDTVGGLTDAGLASSPGWTRVVVEKPFGEDLDTARHLNRLLHSTFAEDQIYRIDHYLAKETVQNLLAFRFANPLFENSWNRDQIESVEIVMAETLGLEGRAGYFDRAGILRDIIQNHLMQVMTLVAMEPPVRLGSDEIRDEKVKVLRAIHAPPPSAVIRGRYTEGEVDGDTVPGYLDEEDVPPDSTTETYADLRLAIDNWRWRGVSFRLRAGKRLPERLTQIVVRYKEPPVCLFEVNGACTVHENILYITLQPNEGFALEFDVKAPGEGMELVRQQLEFRYGDAFGELPDAYETLLADVLTGDQTLFVRADEAEESWRILAHVLDLDEQPLDYRAGTWGPLPG